MLTDYSPGYSDTWESLNRRCQEMEGLSVLSGKVSIPHLDHCQSFGRLLSLLLYVTDLTIHEVREIVSYLSVLIEQACLSIDG